MKKNAVRMSVGSFAAIATLVTACGSSKEIAGDRDPVLSGESAGGAAATGGAASNPDDPVSNDGSGGAAPGDPPELPGTPACAKGFSHENPGDKVCRATHKGTCFESDAEACACAGCGADCIIAESFPTQVFCPEAQNACSSGTDQASAGQKCDFAVKGLCFTSSEAACACAGCAEDKCMILESYPAQIRCQ